MLSIGSIGPNTGTIRLVDILSLITEQQGGQVLQKNLPPYLRDLTPCITILIGTHDKLILFFNIASFATHNDSPNTREVTDPNFPMPNLLGTHYDDIYP